MFGGINKSFLEFKKTIDQKLIEELDEEKYKFILDLQKFNNNCYGSYRNIISFYFTLRVLELKNKFRHLTIKDQKKTKHCQTNFKLPYQKLQRFSSNINWTCQKRKKKFKPIDIICKPTKNPEINPLFYFTEDISKAYINLYNQKDKFKCAYSCYECYYCRKFFLKKDRYKRHIEDCAGVPGVIYENYEKSNKFPR